MFTPPPRLPLPTPAPRLALVIGSGGVRSAAAIGVYDVLASAGLRPDLIVGCSSGALIGAGLATGMGADLALRTLVRMWTPELTGKRRWRAYLQLALPRLARFGPGFALRDDGAIRRTVETAFGETRIESLPTPLRIAATDAASGRPVVLRHGRLADAVRASMAVPFLFPSVDVDGRRLVDGVVSDPLPIGAAHDARAVVALGFEGALPRRVDRASRLVAQASTTLINNLMQARTAGARAAGQAVLQLDLELPGRVGLWETAAIPALFEAGRDAAKARLAELRALAADPPATTPMAPALHDTAALAARGAA